MLKIRMQRTGRVNDPSFRIIVVEHTESPKTGNFVEKLGTYNPKTKLRTLDAERVKYWLSKGAKASGTMHNMLIAAGVIEGKKVNVLPRKSPPKKGEVVAADEPVAVNADKAVEPEADSAEGSVEPKEVTAEAPGQS